MCRDRKTYLHLRYVPHYSFIALAHIFLVTMIFWASHLADVIQVSYVMMHLSHKSKNFVDSLRQEAFSNL